MTYHLAGDSTVAAYPAAEFPMAGWGALLAEHVDAPVRNLAVGGGTTESCRGTPCVMLGSIIHNSHVVEELERRGVRKTPDPGALGPGDTVLIQFGHNDQKDPELLGARGGYAERLRAMIADVRAREGRPILCTSVERRRFVGERIAPSHGDYPDAVRDLAHELDVPLIDLQVFTAWLYEDLGVEDSRSLLSHYPRGLHATWSDGLVDDTHFQRRGADKVAAFVAWSLRAIERGDGHRPAAGDPRFGGINPDASAAVPSVGIAPVESTQET